MGVACSRGADWSRDLRGSALWRAGTVLREAREHVSSGASLRFSARPIVPVTPAGLESIGAPAVFRDAAVFQGNLFIAGAGVGLDEV